MLSNLFPPYVEGGAEILAGEIATGLIREGHTVHVLTSASATSGQASQPHVQRTLRLAGSARVNLGRPLWRQLDLPYQYYRRFHQSANAGELRHAVRELQPDVLYIWEITGLGVTSLLAALPYLRLPVVFHLGSYWLIYAHSPETAQSRLRASWLKKWLIGTLPALTWTSLIAVSEAVKEEYARAGYDPARIEVIHNGIAQRFLETPQTAPTRDAPRTGSESAPVRLLFVGRLCDEKGVMIALRALDALRAEETGERRAAGQVAFHLDIVGDGEAAYLGELRAFVREKGLTDRVIFHGKVTQDALIQFYDRSDIMLNTSLWQEPFGLTTVEAMSRGLPVIGTRTGGTTEIITSGVNGLLIEPGDEHALASAIQRLASDPAQRARLADAAQHTVREHFTLDQNVRRVARHLQRAIRGDVIPATATSATVTADACEAPGGARRTH